SSGHTYTTGCIFVENRRGLGVIKLNNAGIIQWLFFNDTLGFGATGYDVVFRFNRVYLAGETGNDVLVTACLDTFGNNLWLYCDTFASCGYAIGVSESRNIYVAGIKYPSPPDWVVLKLDSLGNLCWRYVYDGPAGSYDEASSIVIDRNENIYVGGYSTGLGTSTDFTIIKLDSAGQEQWVYRYDGPASYNDAGGVIGFDRIGNIYCFGYSWGIGLDFCVIKLSPSGQEEWVYRFNGPVGGDDFPGCGVVDDSGNIYVTGVSADTGNIQLFTVMKGDSAGHQRWCYLSRGPDGCGGCGGPVVLDGLGDINVGGRFLNTAGSSQISLVKFNPAGEVYWVYIYPHIPPAPFADGTRGIVADVGGNIYLAGKICVSAWNDDIVVMKFASGQGKVKEVVDNDLVAKNHRPTIFKGVIEFIPQEDCGVKVFDVMGRMVVNKALQSGRKECIKLRSGVYFMRINSAEKVESRKIVVLE
ncbi:MAG: SBBP repeat-containing protein, partial [candidate division WOR-3 bacterium]